MGGLTDSLTSLLPFPFPQFVRQLVLPGNSCYSSPNSTRYLFVGEVLTRPSEPVNSFIRWAEGGFRKKLFRKDELSQIAEIHFVGLHFDALGPPQPPRHGTRPRLPHGGGGEAPLVGRVRHEGALLRRLLPREIGGDATIGRL